ncbi:aspartate/glutamate racemase family protein [Streptomyces roseifaciens]
MPPDPGPPTHGADAEETVTGPSRRHVGVLLPWANQAVEEELPRLAPAHVVCHYARLVPASRTTAIDDTFWHGLRAAAATAVDSLQHLPLDATVLACTSAGFTAAGPPLPHGVVTAFDTLTTVLDHDRSRRIALATPYPRDVTRAEARALTDRGFTILAEASLDLADGYPAIPPADIRTLVSGLPPSALRQADALVLSCTGWRTLPVLTELTTELGLPVVSSNAAIARYATGPHKKADP